MSLSDYNEYWKEDEFEDLVARSLIGLYETKIKREKKGPKCIRFGNDVFERFRKFGCYFAPIDRVFYANLDNEVIHENQNIDIINDGLPNKGVISLTHTDTAYLHTFYIEKIPFLPKPFQSDIKGTPYRITHMGFENDHVWGCGNFIMVDNKGLVQSCYINEVTYDPVTRRHILYKNRPVMHDKKDGCKDFYSIWASITIQTYQDRRYLWNVQAIDGIAKATFGVYPEQIKSLFYARELPETITGRKKPILHWVSAHQRRMKSGTDVDVEKYLRGTHEFVMNGTKFKITEPFKKKTI